MKKQSVTKNDSEKHLDEMNQRYSNLEAKYNEIIDLQPRLNNAQIEKENLLHEINLINTQLNKKDKLVKDLERLNQSTLIRIESKNTNECQIANDLREINI